jgi:hypothetical protein
MGQRAFLSVSTWILCKESRSRINFFRQNLKESLPSAVDESMPLRPMHVLDPVYPQLPIDFDWGILPQGQDDNRQPAPASNASDISQWVSTSQMPIFPSTPYLQSDQRQSYSDPNSQSHWLDLLYNDFAADRGNSTYIPFASFPDDWSSQPPPRIRGYSTHGDANAQPMDMRSSARGSESTGGNWCADRLFDICVASSNVDLTCMTGGNHLNWMAILTIGTVCSGTAMDISQKGYPM